MIILPVLFVNWERQAMLYVTSSSCGCFCDDDSQWPWRQSVTSSLTFHLLTSHLFNRHLGSVASRLNVLFPTSIVNITSPVVWSVRRRSEGTWRCWLAAFTGQPLTATFGIQIQEIKRTSCCGITSPSCRYAFSSSPSFILCNRQTGNWQYTEVCSSTFRFVRRVVVYSCWLRFLESKLEYEWTPPLSCKYVPG